MRFIWIYLGIYFALVIGAVIALWRGGVLSHLSPLYVVGVLVVVFALGAALALVWQWRPGGVRSKG